MTIYNPQYELFGGVIINKSTTDPLFLGCFGFLPSITPQVSGEFSVQGHGLSDVDRHGDGRRTGARIAEISDGCTFPADWIVLRIYQKSGNTLVNQHNFGKSPFSPTSVARLKGFLR